MNKPLLLIFASALALSACNKSTKNQGQAQAAGTQSGIVLADIDKSVKPGDDFDKYANGIWEKTAQIPPDKSNIGVFSMINDTAQKREAALVQDIVKSNPSAGSDPGQREPFLSSYFLQIALQRETPISNASHAQRPLDFIM